MAVVPEEKQKRLEELKQELNLVEIDDLSFLTGWSESTIIDLMKDENFPVLKIGKKNQVSFDALKKYVSQRRIKRGE